MDFSKLDGLIPAVVQDAGDLDVLMVGFMNAEALERTRQSGYVTFFSRTRQALWTKGDTSGNRLAVVRLLADCDNDTLLVLARREGDGHVCHTGQRSCFFRDVTPPRPGSDEGPRAGSGRRVGVAGRHGTGEASAAGREPALKTNTEH